MILVDTNVVSEIMKVAPAGAVVSWLNDQDSSSLFISTISIGEIEYGLRILPDGKRRTHLRERFEHFIDRAFAMRIVPFDETAAVEYGDIMGLRKELGRPLSVPDGQIAAITRSRGYALATRNIRDFEDCGLALINPFKNLGNL